MKGSTIQTLSEYITQLHNNEQLRSQLEQPDFDTTIHTTTDYCPPERESPSTDN
jgi:hypothetical protein